MIGIDVRGIPEVQTALGKFDAKQSKKMLQKASSAGAKVLKGYVKSAAPKRTGALRRSIRSGQTRRHRPAARVWAQKDINRTRGRNTTFYRHMVVGGTKAHRIRFPNEVQSGVPRGEGNIAHPGAKANPFVARGFDAGRTAAEDAIDRIIDQYLASL
jgi:hypothetical protein